MGGSTYMTIKGEQQYYFLQQLVNGDFQVQMSRTRFERLQRLLPIEAGGVANSLEGDTAAADNYLKERLPIINCECGTEILVVPDLQAMNRAIKNHAAQHRKKKRYNRKNEITPHKASEMLSQLTIIKMSE
jgi:hypothetical protein